MVAFGAATAASNATTFCNPINIDYRFALDGPSRREAADPAIVLFKNDYYLFASKAGGYWFSSDLGHWTFVESKGLPIENYAPALLVLGDSLFYTANGNPGLYTTKDPKNGSWQKISDQDFHGDPALFLDTDGRVYLYFGVSLNGAISVVELDPKNAFRAKGPAIECLRGDYLHRGWERAGEENLGAFRENGEPRIEPWIEGSWMTKHGGIYYLQYAAPGTIWKSYADGVFTSASPMGPFIYASYSPFSLKPGGFIGGAGHSSTFQDKQGNYWRVVTMVISMKHRFERRLGIFPAGFDKDGVMHTNTLLGDYPQFLPGKAADAATENQAGWMLLSLGRPAQASTAIAGHPLTNAFDEDVRTYWSAQSGNKGEWLSVDLGRKSLINAVQVNFAEHDTQAHGRQEKLYQQYLMEASADARLWFVVEDKSRNTKDVPHDYLQLNKPVRARYVRLTNLHMPAEGKFAIRDLRIFGKAPGESPAQVEEFTAQRNATDKRSVTLRWAPAARAEGFLIRYGIAPDKLYNSYQVQGDTTSFNINSLNVGVRYYFVIDVINGSGRTKGKIVKQA